MQALVFIGRVIVRIQLPTKELARDGKSTFCTNQLTMNKTYAQVIKQIDNLQREADELRRKEVEGVIDRIKEAVRVYGLTAKDLGLAGVRGIAATPAPKRKRAGRKAGKAAAPAVAKFRDEAGNTWGGRGPRPVWLRTALANGKKLSDFAV